MSQLYNFADDNTDDLLKIFKEESESAVKWFRKSNMIVNPEKSQAIVLQKINKNKKLLIH